MEKPQEIQTSKEAYEKPEVRKIKLAAGEVAAAGCKSMSAAGPTMAMCTSGANCMAVGS